MIAKARSHPFATEAGDFPLISDSDSLEVSNKVFAICVFSVEQSIPYRMRPVEQSFKDVAATTANASNICFILSLVRLL